MAWSQVSDLAYLSGFWWRLNAHQRRKEAMGKSGTRVGLESVLCEWAARITPSENRITYSAVEWGIPMV